LETEVFPRKNDGRGPWPRAVGRGGEGPLDIDLIENFKGAGSRVSRRRGSGWKRMGSRDPPQMGTRGLKEKQGAKEVTQAYKARRKVPKSS